MTEFIGFPRADGAVGIRNHVIIVGSGLAGVNVSHQVAGLIKEIIPVFYGPDSADYLVDILRHPNVAGIVMVEDGSDGETTGDLVSDLERTGKPHQVVRVQGLGSIEAVSKTTRAAIEILRDVSTQRRELVRFSKLLPGLLYVSADLISEVLKGFVELVVEENGRLLWVEGMAGIGVKLKREVSRYIAGDLRPGQIPGKGPGIYRYRGLEGADAIQRAMLGSGAQIMVCPARTGQGDYHPLIPAVDFSIDQDTGPSVTSDPDLSRVRDKQLTTENAGLLLQSEILATASGRFTRAEVLRGVVVAG